MSPSHGTSGQNVQKSDEEAEKVFLQENSFVCEEPEEKPDQSRKRRILRKVSARKRRAAKKPLDTNDSDFQTTSDTFTEKRAEEFADKKVRKAADRAEKAGRNLKKAKAEIPVQKNYTMKRVFEEKTGKAKYLLVPVEKEKPFQPESLKKRVIHRVGLEGVQVVHGKIAEAEKENTAVEGAHKSEQALESAYHYAKAHGKGKEQRKREQISRLEKKKMRADVELAYQEFLRDNPHLNEEGIHKQLQKQLQKKRIQREYVKARRAGAEAGAAREAFRKSTNTVTGIAKKLQEIAANPEGCAAEPLTAVDALPKLRVNARQAARITNGVRTTLAGTADGRYVLLGPADEFLGIVRCEQERLQAEKILMHYAMPED